MIAIESAVLSGWRLCGFFYWPVGLLAASKYIIESISLKYTIEVYHWGIRMRYTIEVHTSMILFVYLCAWNDCHRRIAINSGLASCRSAHANLSDLQFSSLRHFEFRDAPRSFRRTDQCHWFASHLGARALNLELNVGDRQSMAFSACRIFWTPRSTGILKRRPFYDSNGSWVSPHLVLSQYKLTPQYQTDTKLWAALLDLT